MWGRSVCGVSVGDFKRFGGVNVHHVVLCCVCVGYFVGFVGISVQHVGLWCVCVCACVCVCVCGRVWSWFGGMSVCVRGFAGLWE